MDLCDKIYFKEVFKKWNISIQRFVLAKGIRLDTAKDIVQDCFLKLWNNCSKVEHDKLNAYLFTIAKNQCVDFFRKEKTKNKLQLIAKEGHYEDGHYLMEMSEFKLKLENAINGMSDASKEVFIMHRYNDFSYKQISESLGIGIKAVEKRMHKALVHLSKQNIFKKR